MNRWQSAWAVLTCQDIVHVTGREDSIQDVIDDIRQWAESHQGYQLYITVESRAIRDNSLKVTHNPDSEPQFIK